MEISQLENHMLPSLSRSLGPTDQVRDSVVGGANSYRSVPTGRSGDDYLYTELLEQQVPDEADRFLRAVSVYMPC